jgi:hypothetical protein
MEQHSECQDGVPSIVKNLLQKKRGWQGGEGGVLGFRSGGKKRGWGENNNEQSTGNRTCSFFRFSAKELRRSSLLTSCAASEAASPSGNRPSSCLQRRGVGQVTILGRPPLQRRTYESSSCGTDTFSMFFPSLSSSAYAVTNSFLRRTGGDGWDKRLTPFTPHHHHTFSREDLLGCFLRHAPSPMRSSLAKVTVLLQIAAAWHRAILPSECFSGNSHRIKRNRSGRPSRTIWPLLLSPSFAGE